MIQFKKKSPTSPSFVNDKEENFEREKQLWLNYLKQFENLTENDMEGKVHPFFGKMTGNQWNVLIYKHVGHHLKQFEDKNS